MLWFNAIFRRKLNNKTALCSVTLAGLQTVGIFRVGSSKKRVRQVSGYDGYGFPSSAMIQINLIPFVVISSPSVAW